MKKVLLLSLCLTVCAGAAMADHIGMYNENTGINCFRVNPWNPGGSNNVFVIQKFNAGSSASEFKVNNLAGAPYTSHTPTAGYLAIGDPMTGVSFAYQACVQNDIVITRLRFADDDELGLAPTPCGRMDIVPDPTASPPVLQTVDCNGIAEPSSGGTFYWGTGCGGCNEVATRPTTWGNVKALYR